MFLEASRYYLPTHRGKSGKSSTNTHLPLTITQFSPNLREVECIISKAFKKWRRQMTPELCCRTWDNRNNVNCQSHRSKLTAATSLVYSYLSLSCQPCLYWMGGNWVGTGCKLYLNWHIGYFLCRYQAIRAADGNKILKSMFAISSV